MRDETRTECTETRRSFLGAFLAGRGVAGATDRAALHVRGCPSCAAWLDRVSASPPAAPQPKLYTAGLRHRTLAAVEAAAEEKSVGLLWWLVPAALGGFGLWLIAPAYALTRWIDRAVEDPALAFFLAFVVVASAGFVASSAVLCTLLRTGKLSLAPAGPAGPHREGYHE